MKAAVLVEPGVVEIRDVVDPQATTGQVVVRVEGSSICGSDLTGYWGVNARMRLPTIPGHEVSGTVVAVADSGRSELEGLRVAVEPNVSCRECDWCLRGLPNICTHYRVLGESIDVPGGLAEFVVVAEDQVYPLPDNTSTIEGAVIQPLSISYHGVVDRGAVAADETILIIGAGPIGLAALLFARDIGARTVVADVVEDRLQIARRLGADLVIRADWADVAEAMRDATGGRGADVTVEAVGGAQQQSLIDAVGATATRGRIVILGTFAKPPQPFPAYAFKNRELTMLGSHGHPGSFAPTLELVAAGRIRPSDLITHTMPLAEAASAFTMLDERADGVIKVVLQP